MTNNLNREESQLIENYRNSEKLRILRSDKTKNCAHKWVYSGHSHNDDAYVCSNCGKIDFQ